MRTRLSDNYSRIILGIALASTILCIVLSAFSSNVASGKYIQSYTDLLDSLSMFTVGILSPIGNVLIIVVYKYSLIIEYIHIFLGLNFLFNLLTEDFRKNININKHNFYTIILFFIQGLVVFFISNPNIIFCIMHCCQFIIIWYLSRNIIKSNQIKFQLNILSTICINISLSIYTWIIYMNNNSLLLYILFIITFSISILLYTYILKSWYNKYLSNKSYKEWSILESRSVFHYVILLSELIILFVILIISIQSNNNISISSYYVSYIGYLIDITGVLLYICNNYLSQKQKRFDILEEVLYIYI
jgi:hypothetical protein